MLSLRPFELWRTLPTNDRIIHSEPAGTCPEASQVLQCQEIFGAINFDYLVSFSFSFNKYMT